MDNHNIPMIVDPAVSCLGVGNDVKEEDAKNTSRMLEARLFICIWNVPKR